MNTKFWILWHLVGLSVLALGFWLAGVFSHSDGIGGVVAYSLLPGIWLLALLKKILPDAVFASSETVWFLVALLQISFWQLAGHFFIKWRSKRNQ